MSVLLTDYLYHKKDAQAMEMSFRTAVHSMGMSNTLCATYLNELGDYQRRQGRGAYLPSQGVRL